MPPLDNPRHENFAGNLASGILREEAYEKVGYKKNRGNPTKLAKKESIVKRVAEIQTDIYQELKLEREHLVRLGLRNAEVAAGLRPTKIGRDGVEVYVYRGDVVNNALKLLGSELGMFTEKKEVLHRARYEEMTHQELLKAIRDEAQLLLEHDPVDKSNTSNGDV